LGYGFELNYMIYSSFEHNQFLLRDG
jgi:hypothetical protein